MMTDHAASDPLWRMKTPERKEFGSHETRKTDDNGDSRRGAPREFWLLQYPFSIFVFPTDDGAKMQQAAYDALVPPVAAGEIIHVREVRPE